MDFPNPFTAPGNWYKGNLHTHTTVSDGSYTPEKAVREYHDAGYHFLALTDHSKVAVTENPWPDEFLLLLGTEFDGDTSDVGESYHILGFGLTRPGEPLQEMTVPRALAWIAERGGEAVFAHPYWSGLVISDLLKWQHAALGIEVFNTTCHASIGKGCSAVHWDDLLGRGKRVWGFAVDDCHGRRDCTTAWVMARAPSLTRDAIMNSLRAGLFYSSYGPSIEDVSIDGDMVSVKTSPVVEINFIAQRWSGGHFLAPAGEQFTEASYKLRGHEMYIRVECRDAQGRWAWANPIYITF